MNTRSGANPHISIQILKNILEAQLPGPTLLSVDKFEKLVRNRIETPIGRMLAIADESNVRLLEFDDRRALPIEMKRFQERFTSIHEGSNAVLDLMKQELANYFSGVSGIFKVPMVQYGTPFEERVWAALRQIPLGETRSYGEMARMLGQPAASRAVGRANGRNQISIIVPCHRVIGMDGALVGYGGRLWRKKWLLDHERKMTSNWSGSSLESFR